LHRDGFQHAFWFNDHGPSRRRRLAVVTHGADGADGPLGDVSAAIVAALPGPIVVGLIVAIVDTVKLHRPDGRARVQPGLRVSVAGWP
jgi:hypothetical protein